MKKIRTIASIVALVAFASCSKDGASPVTTGNKDLYLKLNVDGTVFTYYQYGVSSAQPPNQNDYFTVICGLDNGTKLSILASEILENQTPNSNNVFGFILNAPSQSSIQLDCNKDEFGFLKVSQTNTIGYDINYFTRSGNCTITKKCSSNVVVKLQTYTGTTLSDVIGTFSGTIYEDGVDYDTKCKSSTSHTVEGEFKLKLQN
jgi:hypothetical protein